MGHVPSSVDALKWAKLQTTGFYRFANKQYHI